MLRKYTYFLFICNSFDAISFTYVTYFTYFKYSTFSLLESLKYFFTFVSLDITLNKIIVVTNNKTLPYEDY